MDGYMGERSVHQLEFDIGSHLREFHLHAANKFLNTPRYFKRGCHPRLAPTGTGTGTGNTNNAGWYLGASTDRGAPDYWLSTTSRSSDEVRTRTLLELKSHVASETARLDRHNTPIEIAYQKDDHCLTATNLNRVTLDALLQVRTA